jgi:hypothetical protein
MSGPFAFTLGHSHPALHAESPRTLTPDPVRNEALVPDIVLNYMWRLCGVRAALPFFFAVIRLAAPRSDLQVVHLHVLPETANPGYTRGSTQRSLGFH